MKIAICSNEETQNSKVSDRFARSEYFAIYNDENETYEIIENKAKFASGGASGQAVRILSDYQVDVVLCTKVGPKALEALQGFEIRAFDFNQSKDVKSALSSYLQNSLNEITSSHNMRYK